MSSAPNNVLSLATFIITNIFDVSVIILAINAMSKERENQAETATGMKGKATQVEAVVEECLASMSKAIGKKAKIKSVQIETVDEDEPESQFDDKADTNKPEEVLHNFVNNLLNKPSNSESSQNQVTNTQTVEDFSREYPALLYFDHNFSPNDANEGVVNNVVSELIQGVERARQTRQIRPLPRRDKKASVLSELQRTFLSANALNVLQEETKKHDAISFRQILSQESKRSEEASTSSAHDSSNHVPKQEVPKTKAQETQPVSVESSAGLNSEEGTSKPPPVGATASQDTGRTKEASTPGPVVQNSSTPAPKSEVNETPKAQPEPVSRPVEPSATDVKSGPKAKPPPTNTDRPKEAPTPTVPVKEVKEVNGTKTQPQASESAATSAKTGSGSSFGSSSKPSPATASAANPLNKEQLKEGSKPTQNVPQGANETRTQSQPAHKPAESSSANVKPKVETGSNSEGGKAAPAAATSTTKAAEAEAGTGTGTKASDRPTRTRQDIKKEEVGEVFVSAAYARERPSKSRPAQEGRGRVVPKPVETPDPAPEVKRDLKKEEKTETKPAGGSAPAASSSAKVNPAPPLKEEKKPAHGETGSSQSASSSNGSAGVKKEKKSSSAAVHAAFEEIFGKSKSASSSRQSEARAKSPPPAPRSGRTQSQSQPQPQPQPQPQVKSEPQQEQQHRERTPPKPSPPPCTEPAPAPPRTEYVPPKPRPPSPPPSPRTERAPPKPAPDPYDRYYYSDYQGGSTVQCCGITKQGVRCLNKIATWRISNLKTGKIRVFCHCHGEKHGSNIPISVDPSVKLPGRCSAITHGGTLCSRSARHYKASASKYGYCTQHAKINGLIY